MSEELWDLFRELPDCLGGHMLLSVTALAVGLAVSVPLGIWVSRRSYAAEAILTGAGVLQTIPSLALLALMVPLLGGMIGFWPAFCALTLYSLLPILANTIVGIRGVDPTLVEAGQGLGMSDRQMLFRVQLPLAAPVILTGVRTATVLLVGTATLATPVGQKTLGNYIFEGLNIRNNTMVLFGCVAAALLAVTFDQLIRLLEFASRRRSAPLLWLSVLGLLVLVGGGLWKPVTGWLHRSADAAIVGSVGYTEQHILSALLGDRLTAAGFAVQQRKNMGQMVLFDAVCSGGVDCCIDFTGNVWVRVMKQQEPAPRAEVYDRVKAFLREQYGVECLGKVGFENAYALAMRKEKAQQLGIHKSLAELSAHVKDLKIGGDLQFFRLPEWKRVQEKYNLQFQQQVPMDQAFTFKAVQRDVDVITAYTSDGRIFADDLLVLEDPAQAFPPYDAILLLSPQAQAKPGLRAALLPLIGAINTETMRQANKLVDVDHLLPQQAARQLLGSLMLRHEKSAGD